MELGFKINVKKIKEKVYIVKSTMLETNMKVFVFSSK